MIEKLVLTNFRKFKEGTAKWFSQSKKRGENFSFARREL